MKCWTDWNGCDMHAYVFTWPKFFCKFYFWCLNVTERVSVTSINVGKLGFRKKKIAVNRCK